MYIHRAIETKILESCTQGKVIVLTGGRRVGKTYLLKNILKGVSEPFLFLNGDDLSTHDLLERKTVQNYKDMLAGRKFLVIDEAQKIPFIGEKLKLIIDEIEGVKVIITGSSAFDIHGKTGEPLTGRKISFTLFPLSELELSPYESITERGENLHSRLVFGNYPELLNLQGIENKTDYLRELVNSLLLKDIFSIDSIKNSSKMFNLLRLIAYQIGSEVSVQELAKQLQISRATVDKYLDLLTKFFVIFKVEGFSRNLRKEIVKNSKWYFYDIGIRNAIIVNLNPLPIRNDVGQLWENYLISERIKQQHYQRRLVNNYFWRTYDQQEIDWIEERGGKLFAYETKFGKNVQKPPKAWQKAYPDSEFKTINQDNFFDWVHDRLD